MMIHLLYRGREIAVLADDSFREAEQGRVFVSTDQPLPVGTDVGLQHGSGRRVDAQVVAVFEAHKGQTRDRPIGMTLRGDELDAFLAIPEIARRSTGPYRPAVAKPNDSERRAAKSGEVVSGEAVSGEVVSGEVVSGEAVSGEAVSGGLSAVVTRGALDAGTLPVSQNESSASGSSLPDDDDAVHAFHQEPTVVAAVRDDLVALTNEATDDRPAPKKASKAKGRRRRRRKKK